MGDVHADERRFFIPVSTEAMVEHESSYPKTYLFSNDSGQGTEVNTESLRSRSQSGSDSPTFPPTHDIRDQFHEEDLDSGVHARGSDRRRSGAIRSVIQKVADMVSSRVWNVLMFTYNFVDRTILILGFIAFTTGIVYLDVCLWVPCHITSLRNGTPILPLQEGTTIFLDWSIGSEGKSSSG